MVFVLVQVDKDIRHPLLLEQPSLHAAISSWHTDFELQQIFRRGKTLTLQIYRTISYYLLFYITPLVFPRGVTDYKTVSLLCIIFLESPLGLFFRSAKMKKRVRVKFEKCATLSSVCSQHHRWIKSYLFIYIIFLF